MGILSNWAGTAAGGTAAGGAAAGSAAAANQATGKALMKAYNWADQKVRDAANAIPCYRCKQDKKDCDTLREDIKKEAKTISQKGRDLIENKGPYDPATGTHGDPLPYRHPNDLLKPSTSIWGHEMKFRTYQNQLQTKIDAYKAKDCQPPVDGRDEHLARARMPKAYETWRHPEFWR